VFLEKIGALFTLPCHPVPSPSCGSEAGSYLRLIDFVYHSTLGLRVIKKKRRSTLAATPPSPGAAPPEEEFFIDNLLVRIHLIIEIFLVDRPCAMGVPFSR